MLEMGNVEYDVCEKSFHAAATRFGSFHLDASLLKLIRVTSYDHYHKP